MLLRLLLEKAINPLHRQLKGLVDSRLNIGGDFSQAKENILGAGKALFDRTLDHRGIIGGLGLSGLVGVVLLKRAKETRRKIDDPLCGGLRRKIRTALQQAIDRGAIPAAANAAFSWSAIEFCKTRRANSPSI